MKNFTKSDDEIKKEVKEEFKKPKDKLAFDIVKEANSNYDNSEAASEKVNLDIIKHLLKRLDLHIISIDKKAKWNNIILIFLSIIMAIGAIFAIFQYYK
jgi:hypothetical protein